MRCCIKMPVNSEIKTRVELSDMQRTLKRHSDQCYSKEEPLPRHTRLTAPVSCCSDFEQVFITESFNQPSNNQSSVIQSATTFQGKGVRSTVLKTAKARKKRLTEKINDISPKCAKIYKEFIKSKKQVDFLQRARRAAKFAKENGYDNLTKDLNPYAKKIIQIQIILCKEKRRARSFTDAELLISLSIMKRSPKCYRFLQKIFLLPSKSILDKYMSKLDIDVGINPLLMEVMKKEVSTWDKAKKMCSILFGTMHLRQRLSFHQQKDEISGFVHLDKKHDEFAEHALVFMLRGASCKWVQPFAYFFCNDTSNTLKITLKTIVAATISIGLTPVATVCDQRPAFCTALQELQEETRQEQFRGRVPRDETVIFHGMKLSIIYDPAHLIRGLRDNFSNKRIELDGKISSYKDIVDVYLTDCTDPDSRVLHKLNDHHVIPSRKKINKRKKIKAISAACAVFSYTVAALLSFTSKFPKWPNGLPMSTTMKNTSASVKFFDELFDSMNGVSLCSEKRKKLRRAVTRSSQHHKFWREALLKLVKIHFLNKKGEPVPVPTVQSCITTLKSYMRLWEVFQGQGLKVMRPQYFNSEPIEKFLSQMRPFNRRNNELTCQSFPSTFRTLLITSLFRFHRGYMLKSPDQILGLDHVLKLIHPCELNASPIQSGLSQPEKEMQDIMREARKQRIADHSRAYIVGWVVGKVLQRTPCDECKRILTMPELPSHSWISHREFIKFKSKLSCPSAKAVQCFGSAVVETNAVLESGPQVKHICRVISEAINRKYVVHDVTCRKHRTDDFIDIAIKFAIHNWCNDLNSILMGANFVRLEKRLMQSTVIQRKAIDTFKKKLKYKLRSKVAPAILQKL